MTPAGRVGYSTGIHRIERDRRCLDVVRSKKPDVMFAGGGEEALVSQEQISRAGSGGGRGPDWVIHPDAAR